MSDMSDEHRTAPERGRLREPETPRKKELYRAGNRGGHGGPPVQAFVARGWCQFRHDRFRGVSELNIPLAGALKQ
jgi:hypothetical protein